MPGETPALTLHVPAGFDLSLAVCSYGYFLLAPNRWWPALRALDRGFLSDSGRVLRCRITQPSVGAPLHIACKPRPGKADAALITGQLSRMLRLDEPDALFKKFHRLCPAARRRGFGRMFRSPTLFEDIVKTITGCNVTWPNTMRMNRLLVEHVGDGAFPSPARLARMDEPTLKELCKVGYRADRILRMARRVEQGELDLASLENPALSTDEVFERLKQIHGVGDYAASNLCQLLGRYDRLPIDSETYRHFRQHHGVPTPENPASLNPVIRAHYARYAPFEFLAYWFELWRFYEKRVGDAWTWDADTHGNTFTASQLKLTDGAKRKPRSKT